MSCGREDIRELLVDLASKNLSPEDSVRVTEHLGACDSCAGEFAVLVSVAAMEVHEPEAGFWDEMPKAVMKSLAEERSMKVLRTGLRLPGIKWAGGFAAASLAAAVILLLLLRGTGTQLPEQEDVFVPSIPISTGVEAQLLEDVTYDTAVLSEALDLDEELFTEDGLVTITSASFIEGMDYIDMNEEALKLFESDLGQVHKSS